MPSCTHPGSHSQTEPVAVLAHWNSLMRAAQELLANDVQLRPPLSHLKLLSENMHVLRLPFKHMDEPAGQTVETFAFCVQYETEFLNAVLAGVP